MVSNNTTSNTNNTNNNMILNNTLKKQGKQKVTTLNDFYKGDGNFKKNKML